MANVNFFSPDGGTTRYPIEDTEGRTMYEEEIHGVNLLKNEAVSKTENGITFTVNTDGSVTVNGTATAAVNLIVYDGQKRTDAPFKNIPVILSKGNGALVANTSLYCNVYQGTTYVRTIANCQGVVNAESDVFEVDYNGYDGIRIGIAIPNGVTLSNAVFRPMLRKADIEDSTYRPYNPQAIQNQLNAQGVLGAKNLLPNNATSQTVNGVTFTVNADGSVTANGTKDNTDNGLVILNRNTDNYSLPSGNYILSGNPGENGTLLLQATRNGSLVELARITDTTEEKIAQIESTDKLQCVLIVVRGKTVSNLTFKPMLRLASDPDDTYQPYAMTNRELTEKGIGERHTTTITTGTTGNWSLPHTSPYTISAIRRVEAYAKGYIVIPFVNAEGSWFLKVLSIDMQPVDSQNIEVTYWTFAV